MRYFKEIEGDYIVMIGCGNGGIEIPYAEYVALLGIIKQRPTDLDGYTYMLRADTLAWELVSLPPMPEPVDEPTAEDKAEAYDILMGVSE
jgi:hypothetical protein